MSCSTRVWTVVRFLGFGAVFAWALVRADVAGSEAIPADVLARSDIARANMKQIAAALDSYASENNGQFPPDLRMLYPYWIPDPTVFWHPGDSDPAPTTIDNNTPNQPNSTRISYEYASDPASLCEGEPLIWDNSAANNGGLFVNKLTWPGYFKTDPAWITPTPTRREVAQRNLQLLAVALLTCANQNSGSFPTDLARLMEYGAVCSPGTFWHPGDSDPEPTAITNSVPNAPNSAQISYAYFGGKPDSYPLSVVLLDNSLANNGGAGALVVTCDGAASFVEKCSRTSPATNTARVNLQQIGAALRAYANANGGQFPARLSLLFPAYVSDPTVFWHPGDNDAAPTTINNDVPNKVNSAQISYRYLGADYTVSCDPKVVLAVDNSLSNNGGVGVNILTADGQVSYYAPAAPACSSPALCREIAISNLRQIGWALLTYANNNNGYLPSRLSLLYPYDIPRPTSFWSPGDADPWPLTIDNDVPNQPNSAQISYEYVAAGKDLYSLGPDDILVRDNSRLNNGGTGIFVLYADAHVEYILLPDADGDRDVDLDDFLHFQDCFNGPNRAPKKAGCESFDFDLDADVDLSDFLKFQDCFNGPNRSPACR
jgi:hypothetical protein